MVYNDKVAPVKISRAKSISIFISSIILFIAALILWKQQQIDNNILIKCNYFFENEIYLQFFKFISRYGMGIISLLYSILIFLSLKKDELRHNQTLFMFVLFAFALGSIAGDLFKEIVGRARPVAKLSGMLLQTELSDTPSFPSGHAAKSMGLALPFLIMALNKDTITKIFKVVILSFGLLVCFSRIALQKHYLSDVLSGIAVALLFVIVAIWFTNYIYRRRNMTELKLIQINKRLGFVFMALAALLCYF